MLEKHSASRALRLCRSCPTGGHAAVLSDVIFLFINSWVFVPRGHTNLCVVLCRTTSWCRAAENERSNWIDAVDPFWLFRNYLSDCASSEDQGNHKTSCSWDLRLLTGFETTMSSQGNGRVPPVGGVQRHTIGIREYGEPVLRSNLNSCDGVTSGGPFLLFMMVRCVCGRGREESFVAWRQVGLLGGWESGGCADKESRKNGLKGYKMTRWFGDLFLFRENGHTTWNGLECRTTLGSCWQLSCWHLRAFRRRR